MKGGRCAGLQAKGRGGAIVKRSPTRAALIGRRGPLPWIR